MVDTLLPRAVAKRVSGDVDIGRGRLLASVIGSIPNRVAVLTCLVRESTSFAMWRADLSAASLPQLRAWIETAVETRPTTEREQIRSASEAAATLRNAAVNRI